MIDASEIPELSQEDITEMVRKDEKHPHYDVVCNRAQIMRAWHNARAYNIAPTGAFDKSQIIRKSPIESQSEYNERLENFDLLPLEHKFLQTQQRIYDENNVERDYPDTTRDFWKKKESHFDDCGDEVDVFFRDKVLFTKEVEGFGAICLDVAMNNGRIVSIDGQAVPYAYIIQAEELLNYKTWYGHLQLVLTRVKKGSKHEYRAFTPNYIYVYEDQTAEPTRVEHRFGRTPAQLLKGAVDSNSGFKVGKPRRWDITGLYMAASELFYDLKKASSLFGHPIPAYSEGMLKQMSGVWDDENNEFIADQVREEVGMVITYPDDSPPNKLFYQADMQGLQHLREVIFGDLINLIYQIAQVRDKSKVVHNASGRSKQFDSVEEQGLLAQTATDMEAIEKSVFEMMANVRGESFDKFNVVYSKHHDLSSADEIWKQFTEGVQYGGVPATVKKYQVKEYLRKKSAPNEVRMELAEEIMNVGFPMSSEELNALKDKIDDTVLILKTRPELANESARNFIIEQLENVNELLGEDDTSNEPEINADNEDQPQID